MFSFIAKREYSGNEEVTKCLQNTPNRIAEEKEARLKAEKKAKKTKEKNEPKNIDNETN